MDHPRFPLRSAIDVLALAPAVLGFHPEESVVLLGFGQPGNFHARIDLPESRGQAEQVADLLAIAAARNCVEHTVLLIYSDDPVMSEFVAVLLTVKLLELQIGVLDSLRVHAGCFWKAVVVDADPGTPYDISTHPLMVQRILEGHVVHGQRDDLVATLASVPGAVERVAGHLREARAAVVAQARVEAFAWLYARLQRYLGDQEVLSDADVARVLATLAMGGAEESAWAWLDRAQAAVVVPLWIDVLQRSPTTERGRVAGVLAFTSWLAGNGALAWCAIEAAQQSPELDPLASKVVDLLMQAIPPTEWIPQPPWPITPAG